MAYSKGPNFTFHKHGNIVFDLTHARHDQATCLAPGLFRSLAPGERKNTKLDITYSYSKTESLRFWGPEPLGADDMRVLQVLVAAAGPKGLLLEQNTENETGKQLHLLLDMRFAAAEQDAAVIKEPLTWLLKEAGLASGGKGVKLLRKSLERMSAVTIFANSGANQSSFHLLSYTANFDDGKLWIALNPRITKAVFGSSKQYTRLKMDEIRQLESDPARLVHQRLCGWVDQGSVRYIETDTLVSYVWPAPASKSAQRKRRERIRNALAELQKIGWKVSEYAKNKYEIQRPQN